MTPPRAAHFIPRPARRIASQFLAAAAAVSAIEFALIAPILCLILAVTIDAGSSLYTRFGLNQAVSASANYALVHGIDVSSANGAALAASLAAIIPGAFDAKVTINNGPTMVRKSGALSSSGAASNADNCYRPSGTASALSWGAAMACNAGGAGKFVVVSASQAYAPLFGDYGIFQSEIFSASAIVQVQ
jgi:Flp pilus assembly protein TadG